MFRILLIFTLIVLSSCHRSKDLGQKEEKSEQVITEIPAVITEMGFSRKSDPCRIYSLDVSGTVLSIAVEYGGGCKDHTFELYTDGVIMKSLPPKQRFFLKHDADNDMCKALVRDTLSFELKGIRPAGTDMVVILEGYEKESRVSF